jgi:hypothetical protein
MTTAVVERTADVSNGLDLGEAFSFCSAFCRCATHMRRRVIQGLDNAVVDADGRGLKKNDRPKAAQSTAREIGVVVLMSSSKTGNTRRAGGCL